MILSVLHSFVNIFVGGRGSIKAIFFALYLIVLLAVFFLLKEGSERWLFHRRLAKFLERLPQIPIRWPIFTILATYFYHLLLQIIFIIKFRLPAGDFFVIGNNELSSSSIWHAHIMKGAIGQILYFFQRHDFSGLDAGGAYVGFLPAGLFIIGALLMVILSFQVAWFFVINFLKFIEGKNLRQQLAMILAYAIFSFAVVETAIDGGFLVRGFFISVLALLAFLWQKRRGLKFIFLAGVSILGVAVVFFAKYYQFLNSSTKLYLALTGVFICLYSLIIYLSLAKKINWYKLILLLAAFLTAWYITSARDREIYGYTQTLLRAGTEVYYYDDDSKKVDTLVLERGATIDHLAQEKNKNMQYFPFFVAGKTCQANAAYYKIFFDILMFEEFKESFINDDRFVIGQHSSPYYDGKYWRSKLVFYVHPCAPEGLSVIKGYLERQEIDKYILYNLHTL